MITRKAGFVDEGAVVVYSVEQAVAAAGDVDEIAVIGGGEIYNLFIAHANRIYRTDVDVNVEGDTMFPALSPTEWTETSSKDFPQGPNDSAAFTLRVFDRKS